MPSRFVSPVLLLVAIASCRSDPSSGEGGDGGSGGTDCVTSSLEAALGSDAPVRFVGAEDGHPSRIAGTFRVAEAAPVPAARAFLGRIGREVGLGTDLEVAAVKRGLAGDYVRFQQRHLGLPVFDREVVVQVAGQDGGSEIRAARLGHARMAAGLDPRPAIDEAAATAAAVAAVGGAGPELSGVRLGFQVGPDGQRLAYRVVLGTRAPAGSFEVFVDARDGSVLEVRDLLRYVDGTGYVFDPNPVASTGDTSLEDRDDEATPELAAARIRVTLPRLDGSGFLRGDYVDARGPEGTEPARSMGLTFKFDRSQDGFEQTMAYFHLDRTQARLQALGFTDVMNRQLVVIANGSDVDNSWYDPRTKQITTGTGGVDDGEDADVLVHEYGHAMQDDQIPGFGSGGDTGALGEGFGDYLASSIADTLTAQLVDPACLGEWNSRAWADDDNLTCLRRVDRTRHYPEGLRGEVHADGQIWSAVLWEARGLLGADVVDRLVIESHFTSTRFEKLTSAAEGILEADRLLYGGEHLPVLFPVFVDRGLLRTPTPPALLPDVLASHAVDVRSPHEGLEMNYANRLDDRRELRYPGAAGLRLHFTRVDLELHESCVNDACDNIYLTDDAGNLFQILSGHALDFDSVIVPGEAVHVRLVTDAGTTDLGYRIDRVDVMGFKTCGNGARDGTEACEGPDLAGVTCEALGYTGGAVACGPDCRLDVSACVAPDGCGDGEVGPGEECDGANLLGEACRSMGFRSGNLSCTPACKLDTSACYTCGDGARQVSEACEGADVGGLGCGDFGRGTGALGCSPACTFDFSACVPDECA